MRLRTLLELARISNLPTVWSNVLAGAVLGGATLRALPLVVVGGAGTLLYSGGMLLNDAFDAEIDRRERPERPIPSGRASGKAVLLLGFAMLALAILALVALAASGAVTAGPGLVTAGLGTAAAVVVYDRWHKGFAWSPVVMGVCRAGLYVMGALSVSRGVSHQLLLAAATLLLYVVGLTHIARFETSSTVGRARITALLFAPAVLVVLTAGWTRESLTSLAVLGVVLLVHVAWTVRSLRIALAGGSGHIPRAVVALIAGISLVDASFVAKGGTQALAPVALALLAFGLTLFTQRWVRGT